MDLSKGRTNLPAFVLGPRIIWGLTREDHLTLLGDGRVTSYSTCGSENYTLLLGRHNFILCYTSLLGNRNMASATQRPPLSRSTEDYLKVIYQLEVPGGAALTSDIAEALDVAPPSVSGMLKRLAETGLLEHVPYRGVQLTEAGRRAALRMVRRHRIIESYLTSKLGYDWDNVHEEAERLEHAVSDELIERMALALGHPRYDPHGAPIPTTGGDIERPELLALSEIEVGEVAELRMVSDKDPDRLRFLASLGLKPGVAFQIVARQPFQGPVTIRFMGHHPREEVVGHELASSLWCSTARKDVG